MKTKLVNLMELVEPEYITLTGLPANRSGFKVVRGEEKNMSQSTERVRKRAKRVDNRLMSIIFPSDMDKAEVQESVEAFGMEDYSILYDEDGEFYYAQRVDADKDAPTVEIPFGKGMTAVIAEESVARADATISGVTVVGFEFDEQFESTGKVEEWLAERGVSVGDNTIEQVEGGHIVSRHDAPEDALVKKLPIGGGVTATVARTTRTDVPMKIYRSVIEQAYGNWGWGHLNFGSALADPAFTDQSWDAIYVLRDVLENIILYSGLNLDERKTLVQNACDQFTAYLTSLMDALPREVIDTARSDNSRQENSTMAKDTKQGTDKVNRSDDKDEAGTPEYVTREDLDTAVSTAVTTALEAFEAKRTDGKPGEDKDDSADKLEKDDTSAVERNDDGLAEVLKGLGSTLNEMGESMKAMRTDLDAIGEDTHINRSEDDEGSDQEGTKTKRSEQSVFKGCFNQQKAQ